MDNDNSKYTKTELIKKIVQLQAENRALIIKDQNMRNSCDVFTLEINRLADGWNQCELENQELKDQLKEIKNICNCQGDCDGCLGCIGLIKLEVDKALKGVK